MTEIIVGLITGLCAVTCQIIISRTNGKKAEQTQAESQQLIIYRIDKLEEKVNKHNNLITRTYELERSSAIKDEQIKIINHRIEDLEGKV